MQNKIIRPLGDSLELRLAVQLLIKFGNAVEGAPIQLADLTEGEGSKARPSLGRIQKLLEKDDVILVKLSTANFFALRLCEMRHILQLPASIVVHSLSEYFNRHAATPFFQGFLGMEELVTESAKSVIERLDSFSRIFLSPKEVYATIEHYLIHASCFRWGEASGRHGPPNRFSLEQYRSGANPTELQRLYKEYQAAKIDDRPMQLFLGDQYNFTHAEAVGPNAVSKREPAAGNLNALARELTQLVDQLRSSNADGKSPPVCIVAAAAEAASAGNKDEALAHLSSIKRFTVEKDGKRFDAKEWVIDNASKIGVGLATAALKTALGI